MAIQTKTISSPTEMIAGWISTMDASTIPANVREAARWLILDHLACSIGGSTLKPGRILLELFGDQGGNGQATIFATGEQTSLLNAVYVNAALSNLLDFDDTFSQKTGAHPGGTVITPALSVAEAEGRSGEDVVTAIILAYEVMLRLGHAMTPTPERYRQVAGLGTFQTIGAIVAASRLLRLDPDQTRHALGLGLVNAPVPNMRKLGLEPDERPFSWSKNNYGWAAQGGVLGALLAHRGFHGNQFILDGPRGFWLMAGSDQYQSERLTAGLGEEWLLPQTGFKPYASCRWTHTALDAVRAIQAQQPDLQPADITRLELQGFFEVTEKLSEPDPTDIIDAQFSVRHVMALELLGRSPRYGLREADLVDPEVAALRHQIDLVENPTLTQRYLQERKMPALLTVDLVDGRQLTAEIQELPGSPANPMSHDEIRQKYRSLVEPVLGPDASQRLETMILDADENVLMGKELRSAIKRSEESV